MCLWEGGFVSQVGASFRSSCSGLSGVESLGNNWWRPCKTNEAGKSGQPPLFGKPGDHQRGRQDEGCDVHAWTWGFRVMECVYPSATANKLRTTLSGPDTGPTATHRRSLQRKESLTKKFLLFNAWVARGHVQLQIPAFGFKTRLCYFNLTQFCTFPFLCACAWVWNESAVFKWARADCLWTHLSCKNGLFESLTRTNGKWRSLW